MKGDRWYLDEVFCKINGQTCYLWRSVDQEGQVLDVLVQRKRNKHAASRFFNQLKRHGDVPRSITTDKLASYRLPRKQHFSLTPHITDKWANNRAENSHQMTRMRERRMKKFKSTSQAQKFLSAMSEFCDHFQMNRHKATAKVHRILLNRSLILWRTSPKSANRMRKRIELRFSQVGKINLTMPVPMVFDEPFGW